MNQAPVPADPEPPHDGHTIDAGVPTYVGPVRSADPEPEGAAMSAGDLKGARNPQEAPTVAPPATPPEPVGAERISASTETNPTAEVTRTARDVLDGAKLSGFRLPEGDPEGGYLFRTNEQAAERAQVALATAGLDPDALAAEVTALRALVGELWAEVCEPNDTPDWLTDESRQALASTLAALGAGAPAEDEGDGARGDAEPDCHAGQDGDCNWSECPQNRDGEPQATGRSCPRWVAELEQGIERRWVADEPSPRPELGADKG